MYILVATVVPKPLDDGTVGVALMVLVGVDELDVWLKRDDGLVGL